MQEDVSEQSGVVTHAKQNSQPALERVSFWVALAVSFLMPIFIFPTSVVSVELTKALLISLGAIVALVLWLVSRLKEGSFVFQKNWLTLAGILVAVVSLVASFFSSSFLMSLIGEGSNIDTFATIFVGIVLMFLIPQISPSRRGVLMFFTAFLASTLILGVTQIARLVTGFDFLSFGGVLTSSVDNLLGKWSDLGIFFGLGALLSFLSIEFLKTSKFVKVLLYLSFLVSLFFLILVNFEAVWVTVGILSFILFVYLFSYGRDVGGQGPSQSGSKNRKISGIAIILIAISLISIISGNALGNVVSRTFDIEQIEARPAWKSTFDIAKISIKESPVLGVGPNRFFEQWLLNKPDGINETAFWNIDFNAGIGYIPTTLTTSGVLGALSWAFFLLMFLWLGIKFLFVPIQNSITRFVLIGSYIGALYLWIFAFVYIPSLVLFFSAFLFTGLFISSATRAGLIKTYEFNFINNSRFNFASVLFSTVLIIVASTAGYFIVQRYVAAAYVGTGIRQFIQEGDLDKSEASIERGIRLNPSNDRFHRALSDIRVARLNSVLQRASASEDEIRNEFQSVLAGAIQSAQSAVQVDTRNYANWMSLGRVYESIAPLGIDGAYQNASGAYEQALLVNPHSPSIHLTLARLEAAQGNNNVARVHLSDALDEKSNYTQAIFLLSQIEVNEGNIAQAARSVETAAAIAPNDPIVFFQLGFLRYSSNDFSGAISALERAVSLNSSYANARYFLGLSYDQVGNREGAISQFEKILETNSNNEEALFILNNLKEDNLPFADVEPPLDGDPELREDLPLDE